MNRHSSPWAPAHLSTERRTAAAPAGAPAAAGRRRPAAARTAGTSGLRGTAERRVHSAEEKPL